MSFRLLAAAVAALGLGGVTAAGDDTTKALGRYKPVAGGFAGAVQSAAAAEKADVADDSELIGGRGYYGGGYGYRGGYGYGGYGYRGGYYGGGYGYRGGYYGGGYGYRGGYGYGVGWYGGGFYGGGWYGRGWYGGGYPGWGYGYASFYRPWGYYGGYGWAYPRSYIGVTFASYPSYVSYATTTTDCCTIAGTTAAPAQTVGLTLPRPRSLPAPTRAAMPEVTPAGGSTPTPVPPTVEPARVPDSVNISLVAKKPALKYPAYGEKK